MSKLTKDDITSELDGILWDLKDLYNGAMGNFDHFSIELIKAWMPINQNGIGNLIAKVRKLKLELEKENYDGNS